MIGVRSGGGSGLEHFLIHLIANVETQRCLVMIFGSCFQELPCQHRRLSPTFFAHMRDTLYSGYDRTICVRSSRKYDRIVRPAYDRSYVPCQNVRSKKSDPSTIGDRTIGSDIVSPIGAETKVTTFCAGNAGCLFFLSHHPDHGRYSMRHRGQAKCSETALYHMWFSPNQPQR